jgi:murein DD-endopeptidase MepM/ murein hydrolase activator NlpD
MTGGCGPYPAEATSPYVLPYEAGSSYRVSQGNCTNFSHVTGTPDQYAYDFVMPIGTVLIASRGGTVTRITDTFEDNTGVPGDENVVGITHADGITFSNTDPHPNGLVAGRSYPAR